MGEEAATVTVRKPRIQRKRLVLGVGVALTILLLLGVGTLIYKKSRASTTLPKEVKSQVSGFQPYFSQNKELPAGYTIDRSTIKYELGTLFFTVTSPQGKKIVISEQPVPKEFSAEGGAFVGKESIDTKNGKATIAYVQGRTSAFMITNDHKTMVILNSNQALETDTIRSILSSLNGV